MEMAHVRRGTGEPLVLVHGLGGSRRTWTPILDDLAAEREVIAVDLPGHGETPALSGEVSIDTLADAVTSFLDANDLGGADHYPHWDAPDEATELILTSTADDE